MKIKYGASHSVRIFIGSQERYKGKAFSEEELISYIGTFQRSLGLDFANTVRVTQTKYVWKDYVEDGYEVAIINYLRNEKSTKVIDAFMFKLGTALLEIFNQNRISIEFPDQTLLLEAENAEQSHK